MHVIWSVDISTGIVTSNNGFVGEFKKGLLIEISGMPKGISTKDIKQYSLDAKFQYTRAKEALCVW